MLQNTKFLVLLLCLFSASLFAQQSGKDKPVFNKVEKAKIKTSLQEFNLFTTATTNLKKAGIQQSTLQKGTLLDLNTTAISKLRAQQPEALSLTLPLPNQKNIKVNLVRNKVLTPDFILRQSSNPGQEMKYDPGLYFTGVMENDPNSLVSISVFAEEIIGMIHTQSGNYVIGKVKNTTSKQHLIYKDTDLLSPTTLDCGTEDDGYVYKKDELTFTANRAPGDCIRIYIEIDDDIVTDKGGAVGATNYITGVMNEVITLYANDNMTMAVSEILAWDTPAPYSGSSSSAMLSSYQANTGTFNGDLSHLVSYQASGGIAAGFSGICNSNVDNSKCFSSINSTYSAVPAYSYTVMVMAHEMGHLIGSRHTHACVWNGNGTAIDGCAGFTEGGCAVPGSPASGGTIMSYCHLTTGIDFTQGFGPQPQAVLLNTIANATCLSACSGPTCSDGVQNGDENGVDCGGTFCPPCNSNCTDNEVTVNFTFDNYPEETSWDIRDAGGAVIASGGTYPNQADGSSLSIPLCLVDGCYDFTIYDTYGDGICCGFGNGSYSVTDANGNVLAAGGAFGTSETTNFCVPANNDPIVLSLTATDVTCLGGSDGTASVSATGGSGTYTYLWNSGGTTATITGLNAGVYEVTVDDGTDTATGSIEVMDGQENTYYADTDGDGFGDINNTTIGGCTAPAGYVSDNTDCDDTNGNVYPGATEICDGIDNNCDGQIDENGQNTYYADTDGDGYGDANNSIQACSAPAGYVSDNTDCDDTNSSVYPGAPEICDGVDNNCNGQVDEGVLNTYYADTDGDGFGDANNTTEACTAPAGYVNDNTDCDDTDAAIYIGATCDDNNPNTSNDMYDSNCNCVGTPTTGCQDNEVTLTLVLDNYPGEVSWDLAGANGAVLYQGGTYPGQTGATISETFCLPDDCYTFTMYDSYGDGICCAYGNGSYTLTDDATGQILASGGDYDNAEATPFCVPFMGSYCDNSGNNSSYEWIESVSLGNVSNTSGNDGGYGNYSNQIVNASVGQSVSLTITPGFNNAGGYVENYRIWVDYNHDFDFDDAGEEVFAASNNGSVSGSFVIPASASTSPIGIRVAMGWGSAPGNCGSFSYGEVEDYTLQVGNTAPITIANPTTIVAAERDTELENSNTISELQLFPNPAKDWLNIQAKLPSNASAHLMITDLKGGLVFEQTGIAVYDNYLEERIDLSDLPSGMYFVRILNGEDLITQRFMKSN